MTEFDLTGTWEGHYAQNGRQHGISMRVVQRGASFVGAMRDVDTLLVSQQQLHAASAEDGKASELLGAAEVLSSLPEHSFVEGEVEGRLVTFTKRYQGKSSTSIWVRGKANLTFETPGHVVHYRGVLSPDGRLLSGMWRIPPQHRDDGRMRDQFLLRRTPTA